MSETQTLYKLIILYLLSRIDFPLSNGQITEFLVDKEYTDYFTVQNALFELNEAHFVQMKAQRNTSLYLLTKEGRDTLQLFCKNISPAIRDEVDLYLTEHGHELRNELSTPAIYYRTSEGEYAARCQVLERTAPILDLTLTVPTEEQAASICNHWREKSQAIYARLIQDLLM